jgi:hypothetical protein
MPQPPQHPRQWCEAPQASMPIRVGRSLAKNFATSWLRHLLALNLAPHHRLRVLVLIRGARDKRRSVPVAAIGPGPLFPARGRLRACEEIRGRSSARLPGGKPGPIALRHEPFIDG